MAIWFEPDLAGALHVREPRRTTRERLPVCEKTTQSEASLEVLSA